MVYITIDGVHGIGKTTLCKNLARLSFIKYFPETSDKTILPPTRGPNSDPLRFQIWFARQKILQDSRINEKSKKVQLADRSWQSNYIYSKAQMDQETFILFGSVLDAIEKKEPDLEILLWLPDDKIDEILFRNKQRARSDAEKSGEYDIEYARKINAAYKEYYDKYHTLRNIVLIDASKDFWSVYAEVKKIIKDFVAKQSNSSLMG